MNKLAKRAWFALALAGVLLLGMGVIVVRYFIDSPDWVTFQNSAHNADYYGVIRFTAAFGVTGMILEHSFHTNTRMTTWLLDDENLKRLAAAEAAVLAEHYGLKKTADEPQRAETVCYHLLSDVPQGDYRTVLDRLIAADILRGRSGTGEERVLDLTEDSVRLLVLLDRAGAFGS